MKVKENDLVPLLEWLKSEELLTADECRLASNAASDDFYFAEQMATADSFHLHIHVPETDKLPHAALAARGGLIENKKEGYIKYGFPGNVKLIFSHIPVAQKEQVAKSSGQAYLDHIGIDIRNECKEAYVVFQQIPLIAAQQGIYFKRQGDGVEAVTCCHMQVKEKYWVYAAKDINYEFAFGPLIIQETGFGVDLRPANPFNKALSEGAPSCCNDRVAEPAKTRIFLH